MTTEATGLLIDGRHVEIPGITVVGPNDTRWAKLDPRDYRPRPKNTWLRQIIIHTTKGLWPQHVVPAPGPGGRDESTAKFWSGDPQAGGAQIVVDDDGSIACLCDLVRVEAYHATTSNAWSVGIEMYQRPDGGIHEATLHSTLMLVLTLCEELSIPLQIPWRVFNDRPIERMRLHGGPDMTGVFGHRDNSWKFAWQLTEEQRRRFPDGYSNRGRGDPGDEIFSRLSMAGAEPFDFDAREDLIAWKRRQARLNALGARLDVDGIAGPATMRSMRALGFASGRALDV